MTIWTDQEALQLARILGTTPANLDQTIQPYAQAATEEYVRMILGQRIYTRGSDMREYRLLLLLKHVFTHDLPTESQISSLFQTTTTQSRALLKSVLSKYQYDVNALVTTTLTSVLEKASPDPNREGGRLITIDNTNVVDLLNRRVAEIDGTLAPVIRVPGTTSTYAISPDTYHHLIKAFRE